MAWLSGWVCQLCHLNHCNSLAFSSFLSNSFCEGPQVPSTHSDGTETTFYYNPARESSAFSITCASGEFQTFTKQAFSCCFLSPGLTCHCHKQKTLHSSQQRPSELQKYRLRFLQFLSSCRYKSQRFLLKKQHAQSVHS